MATLTIRNLDNALKAKLRIVAATHGRSMEEEVRVILKRALEQPQIQGGLGSRIHNRFAAVGGAEIDLPARNDQPRSADVSE